MDLLILDRDGVINFEREDYVKSPREWKAIPGSLDAIARLNRAGWRVVVACNQTAVGHGLVDFETLNRIHDTMLAQLREQGGTLEAIFFCPCAPEDDCACLKPRPGMLKDIARRLRISMEEMPVVGDMKQDLEAAWAVSARPILVRTGQGALALAAEPDLAERCEVYDDLAAVADQLVAQKKANTP